ncbi:Putative type VI secretion protein IcmF [Candidatus Bealeia paramacronuclearis]|uniref:Type VI secretion protein IcmF n=1 Tax=Candidatus Bealeia paramacronuclearis TaxID=1921001 RepID=A0ABZ2C5S8_9PROT|nr:putative type VI secretion protein IcmF [Candidatus Bealeia paramacronuclearis]
MGAKGSGKSSFIQSLNLDLPLGHPGFSDEDQAFSMVDWNFFNHGILIESDGGLVMDSESAQSDEEDWRLLLDSFSKYRPKRPLDGIILTIPYEELIVDGNFDVDDQTMRSEYLYKKLWEVQKVVGLRLPIYIVVTKCDQVAGFDSFLKNLPVDSLSGMFGWSNGKSLDVVYRPDWISEAFDTVENELYQAQEEIYTQGITPFDRAGVFLFPLSLNKLKEGLQVYCDHLFRDSSYHESFFLRGIYFTGNYEDEATKTPQIILPSHEGHTPFNLNMESLSNIAFTTSLVEDKVFREVGLARPVSGVLLGNTKALNIAKTGVAVGAIIGTLGLLKSNENLRVANMNLLPTLQQIEVQLEGVSDSGDSKSDQRAYFDNHAQILLDIMSKIQVNSLFSVFIPSSWFSALDVKIQNVMTLAYDQVVFQSLYAELNAKATNLVSLVSSQGGVLDKVGVHSQDPLASPEFYTLQDYVREITTFEKVAEKFNLLSMASTPDDIGKIIKYLFNYDLPESFYEEDEYYSLALLHSRVKRFDFDVYHNAANSKLHTLFQAFEDVAFNVDYMVPGLNDLQSAFQKLRRGEGLAQLEMGTLRSVSTALNTTLNSINNPSLNWMDAQTFDPGEEYDALMNNIVGSRYFFDNQVAETLRAEAEKRFVQFESELASYQSPLTKGPIFEIDLGNIISNPSQGTLKLQGDLNLFFSQPFMANAPAENLITVIPAGSVLLWDASQLQKAVDMIASYNEFLSSKSMTFPKVLQSILTYTARERLSQNLTTIVANSQILDSSIAQTSLMSPEDALLSQVQNYRITLPLLEQIFGALRINRANTTYAQLKSLVTRQNYALLEKIDKIFEDDHPYAIKDGNFDWWDGANPPSLDAFGVDTLPDLKSYINLQRERIRYLSKEFADPVVQILTLINKEGMPANLPLVNKWNGIIGAVNGYASKAQGDTIITLENYIENTLSGITLSACPQLANAVAPNSFTMDYFTTALQNMQLSLAQQCHKLADSSSSESYDMLASYFNANLAGKFPFVEDPKGVAPDALPSDIQGFFDLMDKYGATVTSLLKEAKNLGAAGNRASEFIDQMNMVRTFFGGFLVKKDPLAKPAFVFKVDFRVNKDREVLGNQIIDWTMNLAGNKIDFRDPLGSGFWQYGEPVSAEFRWAANSPLEPTGSRDNPALQVDGNSVSFTYPGQWGLLRLLLNQPAALSDFNSLIDNRPTTLKFKIPVASSGDISATLVPQNAEVFVRVTPQPLQNATQAQKLLSGDANPGESAKLLDASKTSPLPAFPTSAPVLKKGESS